MKNFYQFREELAKDLLEYNHRKINLKKGSRIYENLLGDTKIVILTKGLLRYNHKMANGREILFGCYREHSFLIIGELFNNNVEGEFFTSMFEIIVSEDSEVALISEKVLDTEILCKKELLESLVEYHVLFYQKKLYQMRDIQMFNLEDAILSLAVRAYNTYGEMINEKSILNHKVLNKNLAKCLGCTEEAVSRAIAKLKKQGVLSKKNGLLVIEDINYVKTRLGCNYCKQSICYF